MTGQKISDSAFPDSLNVADALLGKENAKGRDHLLQQPNRGTTLALRIGDWKVLSYANAKPQKHLTYQKAAGKYELYDLANDPAEKNNLAKQKPERLKRMLERLEKIKTDGRTREP